MAIHDPIFADAIAAIDAGENERLNALLTEHPRLIASPLPSGADSPPYFANPYLLWFVAENPIRNHALPANIIVLTATLLDHLDRLAPPSRQHQLDYAVELVATGKIAREAGVQLPLIDALVARGAAPCGLDAALAHNELAAARSLLSHGAPLTLMAALCLGLDQEARLLLPNAGADARADALLAAASLGHTDAVGFLLGAGVDPNLRSKRIHPHATALHQAALNGNTDMCEMLVARGASLGTCDDLWNGTPSGWAEHAGHRELAARLRAVVNPNKD